MAVTSATSSNILQKRLDSLPLSKYYYKIWFLCTTGGVLDSLDLYLISFALPMIAKDWGLSSEKIGILASAAMWGMLGGSYLWGYLSDRIGRKKSLINTVGIFSIITGLCALAWNSWTLFIGRFAAGIGLGGFVPVSYTIITEIVPAKYRGRIAGAGVMLWPLGGLLGALIAYNLAPVWGWRSLFIVGALPALLIFPLYTLIPESPRFLISRGRVKEAAQVIRELEKKCNVPTAIPAELEIGAEETKAEPMKITELFSKDLLSRTLLASGIWFAFLLAYYGMMLWLPTLFVKYYHIPQAQTLKYMMLLTVLGIFGRAFGMSLVDSWGRKPVMISFAIAASLGILGYCGVKTTTQLITVAAIAAFFYEGMWAAVAPFTAEIFPTRVRSSGIGWSTGVGRISAALSPMAVGFIVDYSLPAVFITLSGLLFVMTVIISVFAFETKGKSLEEIAS